MAKLYNHGHVVAEFSKEGFVTYRLMSDGKWLKSKRHGWKIAKWKADYKPLDGLSRPEAGYTLKVEDRDALDRFIRQETT